MPSSNTVDTKKQYWNRIQIISYILAIMVIIRHNSSFANYNDELSCKFLEVYNILKYSITEIAVPMFFVIAGFNFYNGFTLNDYINKLKRRVKSLVVPYFSWNIIYCIFALITSNTFISKYFIGRKKYNVSLKNIISGCLFHCECNEHFWFIFNLILFAVFCPIIYSFIKNRSIGLITILICFFGVFSFNITLPDILIYRMDSLIYYLIGGYLGLHYSDSIFAKKQIETMYLFRKYKSLSLIIGIILMSSLFLLLLPNQNKLIRFVIICFAVFGLWVVSSLWMNKTSKVFTDGVVFLMYAFHGIIQPIIVKLLYLILPKTGLFSLVNFISSISLTIMFCIALKKVCATYAEPLFNVLTGWRN